MRHRRLLTRIGIGLAVYLLLVLAMVSAESRMEGSNIGTFGDALWYSIVTLTTVGYGDRFPVTLVGRLVAIGFLLGSIGVLGFLIGEITKNINERRERKRMGHDGTSFTDHVVIIGWNDFARTIMRQLVAADRQVAVVTDHKDDIDLIYEEFPADQSFVLFTELTNIPGLAKANVAGSVVVFLNNGDDTEKLIAILNMKKVYTDAKFLVTLDNPDLKETFQSAGVTYALSKNEMAAKLIASYIFEPDVAAYANDLLSATDRAGEYDLQQYRIREACRFTNRTYGEAFWEIKKDFGALLVGIAKEGEADGERTLHKLAPDEMKVETGDFLLVITDGEGERKLVELFGTREGV